MSAFPMKLFTILERAGEEGYQDIISWQPHGRCFIIRNQSLFEARILPKYYSVNRSKVSAFLRQVRYQAATSEVLQFS
jgi:HSF-type DNA-binding